MGTSPVKTPPSRRLWDHPHAYGDKYADRLYQYDRIRIIPTRMGTSMLVSGKASLTEDHPHAYGDKWKLLTLCRVYLGSSPRVWGQDQEYINGVYNDRIIPTRMGTSDFRNFSAVTVWDHPHAYGDKPFSIFSGFPQTGSSPRVWGQVEQEQALETLTRIIPTRMGTRKALRCQTV